MATLTHANRELFRRTPDECFGTLDALHQHCRTLREESLDRWHHPQDIHPLPQGGRLRLQLADDGDYLMNDWSFSQLCRLADVSKDTVNRLAPETVGQVFSETLPVGNKPLQVLTAADKTVRSIHGVAYTRLWNADLLDALRRAGPDFQPPQEASGGGSGLYAGEQDMFVFLIDPLGWAEIDGEAFAPGYFAWNSEVGKRSLGVSTFWFQKICRNHIVWDAVEVVEFSRKHTANIHESLNEITRLVENLARKRDDRKDAFARGIKKAMQTTLGATAEEAEKALTDKGFTRALAKEAILVAREKGKLTVWSVVDALTRLSGKLAYAGDRTEADQKAATLLALAA